MYLSLMSFRGQEFVYCIVVLLGVHLIFFGLFFGKNEMKYIIFFVIRGKLFK
jgi:hypothetical protein